MNYVNVYRSIYPLSITNLIKLGFVENVACESDSPAFKIAIYTHFHT